LRQSTEQARLGPSWCVEVGRDGEELLQPVSRVHSCGRLLVVAVDAGGGDKARPFVPASFAPHEWYSAWLRARRAYGRVSARASRRLAGPYLNDPSTSTARIMSRRPASRRGRSCAATAGCAPGRERRDGGSAAAALAVLEALRGRLTSDARGDLAPHERHSRRISIVSSSTHPSSFSK
jgi:hypothetical protein